MRAIVRSGAAAALAIILTAPASAQAQGGNDAKKAAEPPKIDPNEVLATVGREPIRRAEAVAYANRVTQGQIPPADAQKEVYKYVMDALVNVRLLRDFLREQKVAVTPAEIKAELDRVIENVKTQGGGDFPTYLTRNRLSQSDLEAQIENNLRWKKYFTDRARKDGKAELNAYIKKNRDFYQQNQVRASHILLLVPRDATTAEKEKIKARLLDIKKQIEEGKITFEDAANKYSEDPRAKADQDGGDLGYFYRKQYLDEDFNAAAFALPKNKVSDPVESGWGYHLILVKDIRPGRPLDQNQFGDVILNQFGADLQREILTSERERRKAQIDIKPMPADFFTPNPPPPGAAPAADAKAEKKG